MPEGVTAFRPIVLGRKHCSTCFPGDSAVVTLPDRHEVQEPRCAAILEFPTKAVGAPLTQEDLEDDPREYKCEV